MEEENQGEEVVDGVLEPLGVVKKLRTSKVERLCMSKGTTIANNLNAKYLSPIKKSVKLYGFKLRLG